MENKKAQVRTSLIGIIIIIITAGIILIFMNQFSNIFSETANKETCRTSVNLRATIIEKGFLTETALKLPPLRCQTEYKCLSEKGECEGNYEKVTVKSDNEIKKEISELMYECWDMLGNGEKPFIGSWEGGLLKNDKVCLICSVIDFDSKIKAQKRIEGLGKYMFETNVPGKNFTYIESISGDNNPELQAESEDIVLTEQKQSVIYVIGKTSSLKKIWTDTIAGAVGGAGIGIWFYGIGSSIGAGIGGIIGGTLGWIESGMYKSEYATSLLLVPYESEEIAKYCKDLKSSV